MTTDNSVSNLPSEDSLMPKRSRVLLWSGLLVALASVGVVIVEWVIAPPAGVTLGNAKLLRRGMMLEDVRAIFREKEETLRDDGFYGRQYEGYTTAFWNGDDNLFI